MAFKGSRPEPTHVIAHLSDLHLLAEDVRLHGRVDTVAQLRQSLERVVALGERVDALVLSGDLTDRGESAAYEMLRSMVEPVADQLGAALVMTGGNHDERRPLALGLYDVDTDDPQDRVTMVNGLRVIDMDSAIPGRHDGGFSDAQFDWLTRVLETTAPHGSILVMHHPPIAYHSPLMQLLDFEDVDRLRATLAGTDVRAVLSGHLHVTSFGTLGSIPVYVAGGVSYVDDAGAPRELLLAVDGPQSWNLIEVHEDQIVGTAVPVARQPTWPALSDGVLEFLRTVPDAERRTAFATKRS